MFENDISNERPTTDPKLSLSARSFSDPQQEIICATIGSLIGSLTANRLQNGGHISSGQSELGQNTVDLKSFLHLIAETITNDLKKFTNCPILSLLKPAVGLSAQLLCSSISLPLTVQQSVSIALSSQRITVNTMDTNIINFRTCQDCSCQYFSLKKLNGYDVLNNPEMYIRHITNGLENEFFKIYAWLKNQKLEPNSAPSADINSDALNPVRYGVVIAPLISKILAEFGAITNVPGSMSYDVVQVVGEILNYAIQDVVTLQSQQFIETHRISMKIMLYWLINNFEILITTPFDPLISKSIEILGFQDTFPSNTTFLKTNDGPIRVTGKYITFPDQINVQNIYQMIKTHIPFEHIRIRIQNLTPHVDNEPEDISRTAHFPIPGSVPNDPILPNPKDTVGTLPSTTHWFKIGTISDVSKNETNSVVVGTMAIILGVHASHIMKKLGLLSKSNEPGYSKMVEVEFYQVLQEVIEKLTVTLIKIIPMDVNTGYGVIKGSFKTAKLSLALGDDSNNPLPIATLIPLALKHFDYLQLFPHIQHLQWDLWPIPSKLNTMKLWVKPLLNVSIENEIKERIETLVKENMQGILSNMLSIFNPLAPTLRIDNIQLAHEILSSILPWDPPEVLKFLYDPVLGDEVPLPVEKTRITPTLPIKCPGHFLCSGGNPCHYVCVSSDPWCYLPPGIKCPGSIQCPVLITQGEEILECPSDDQCPIHHVPCPGRSECPDGVTMCPGSSICPIQIKCPGIFCPSK